MLLRKAEEQEKEDRENPENRTKPKPAPEKEAPCHVFFFRMPSMQLNPPGRFSMSLALQGGLGKLLKNQAPARSCTYSSLAGIAAEE